MPITPPPDRFTYADDDDTPNRRGPNRWHLAKEIPIALIIAVVMQTFGGIWWMAQLSGRIDSALSTLGEFKSERYTREDARRDRQLLDQQFAGATNADREIERRINTIESRLDRLEGRIAK